jgi:hypothetical protein
MRSITRKQIKVTFIIFSVNIFPVFNRENCIPIPAFHISGSSLRGEVMIDPQLGQGRQCCVISHVNIDGAG